MTYLRGNTRLQRFIIGGAANSAVTYLVFVALAGPVGSVAAYSIAYVLGIVLSYAINAVFVFGARPTLVSAALFPWIYGVQYLIGLGLLWLLVDSLAIPHSVAIIPVIGVNALVAYFLMRIVFQIGAAKGGTP